MPFEVGQRIKVPMVYDALLNTGIKARYLFHICLLLNVILVWVRTVNICSQSIYILYEDTASHILVEVALYAPLGCLLELGVVQLNGRQLAVSG